MINPRTPILRIITSVADLTTNMFHRPSTSHQERKLFPCDWCHALFTHDTTLYVHQRHECRRRSRYYCEVCPRSFLTPGFLKLHVETQHEPLLCDICPFRCYERAELAHHMRVHNQREAEWVHRRRNLRKRKNVRCTVCQCNIGRTLPQSKDPLTEVTIKVDSTSSVSEVNIKLEPSSDDHQQKTNIERYRETGDIIYLEQTMKEILTEAPGLLEKWYEETYEKPFPLSTNRNPNE